MWWVRTRGFANGHDDVRLVDFGKPDQVPSGYANPGPPALFRRNDAKPTRALFFGDGKVSFCWLRGVSSVAATMSAEL